MPVGTGASDGWTALTKTLEDMQKALHRGLMDDGDDAMHRMMAFWELPYDNWQRMMSRPRPDARGRPAQHAP